jgi:hypothetical protein
MTREWDLTHLTFNISPHTLHISHNTLGFAHLTSHIHTVPLTDLTLHTPYPPHTIAPSESCVSRLQMPSDDHWHCQVVPFSLSVVYVALSSPKQSCPTMVHS